MRARLILANLLLFLVSCGAWALYDYGYVKGGQRERLSSAETLGPLVMFIVAFAVNAALLSGPKERVARMAAAIACGQVALLFAAVLSGGLWFHTRIGGGL